MDGADSPGAGNLKQFYLRTAIRNQSPCTQTFSYRSIFIQDQWFGNFFWVTEHKNINI